MNEVFSKLIINAEKMRENIEISKGLIFTEAIMMKLVERGMSRQEAHEIMRKYAMEAREKGLHLKEVLKENKMISEIFDSIANYTGNAEKIVDIAIQNLREKFPEIGL